MDYRGLVTIANKRRGDVLRLDSSKATLEVLDGASTILVRYFLPFAVADRKKHGVPLTAILFVAQPRALEVRLSLLPIWLID